MSTIAATLAALQAEARTAAQLDALAAALEIAAAHCRQVAAARRREHTRPAATRVTPKRGAGGRPSTPFARILRRMDTGRTEERVEIRLSRAAYDTIRAAARLEPLRLRLERVAGVVTLTPDPAGYACMVSPGGVRLNVSGSRDLVAHLADGRHAVQISARGVLTIP